MESLIINKKELINTIDNIIDELKSVKNAIQIDNELDEVIATEDVKDSIYHQTFED